MLGRATVLANAMAATGKRVVVMFEARSLSISHYMLRFLDDHDGDSHVGQDRT